MSSVTPTGLVWWDIRDDPGFTATDAYYAYSEDNGDTWSKTMRRTSGGLAFEGLLR